MKNLLMIILVLGSIYARASSTDSCKLIKQTITIKYSELLCSGKSKRIRTGIYIPAKNAVFFSAGNVDTVFNLPYSSVEEPTANVVIGTSDLPALFSAEIDCLTPGMQQPKFPYTPLLIPSGNDSTEVWVTFSSNTSGSLSDMSQGSITIYMILIPLN